jgi:putative chitinase
MDVAKLSRFCTSAGEFLDWLNVTCARFEITGGNRLQHFLAQCAHESAGFTRLEEGLNYRDNRRLAIVFRKYFDSDRDGKLSPKELNVASEYCGEPEKLANYVYASRMGNGDMASGDGWKFRGRGIIQTTGRNNYTKLGQAVADDPAKFTVTRRNEKGEVVSGPDLLLVPEGACLSAGYFWMSNGCNELADRDDIEAITARVHGKTFGRDPSLGDRMQWLEQAKECGL